MARVARVRLAGPADAFGPAGVAEPGVFPAFGFAGAALPALAFPAEVFPAEVFPAAVFPVPAVADEAP